uniref:Putative secreted protein n=1 Tax=Rhipicephalus microplus TaxID=6941 RepID=A0A6G5A355_RHIMP
MAQSKWLNFSYLLGKVGAFFTVSSLPPSYSFPLFFLRSAGTSHQSCPRAPLQILTGLLDESNFLHLQKLSNNPTPTSIRSCPTLCGSRNFSCCVLCRTLSWWVSISRDSFYTLLFHLCSCMHR